jgi:hypothetical protein
MTSRNTPNNPITSPKPKNSSDKAAMAVVMIGSVTGLWRYVESVILIPEAFRLCRRNSELFVREASRLDQKPEARVLALHRNQPGPQ